MASRSIRAEADSGQSRPTAGKGRKIVLPTLVFLGLVAATLFGIRAWNLHRFHVETGRRMMMDTLVTIQAVGPLSVTAPAMERAFRRMEEIDAKFNVHRPGSPIHVFNTVGTPITDPEILGVVRAALEISRRTDGAFDPTIAPLIERWGFYDDAPRVPAPEEIAECLDRIGYENLILSEDRLEKARPDVHIDLGAIAKGHAIAEAVTELRAGGVTSALVDAGGDVYALGKKGNRFWRVGIKNPREEGNAVLGHLEAEDLAVVGSGDYERYFSENGARYHHIFDPRTGYPAGGLSGITVISPDPVAADGWATALFVLGPEAGMRQIETLTDLEAVMVTTSGEKILSSGLRGDTLKEERP
jgi:thiamine biosynthesis lipoprotein